MLTTRQKALVKIYWLETGDASHSIACRLGLTHEYVQKYVKELNEQEVTINL